MHTDPDQDALTEKELHDALRKASRYGLPFFLMKGYIYEHTESKALKAIRRADEYTQTLWDALA